MNLFVIHTREMRDPKAIKILMNTFWTAEGWRRIYLTPPEDFEYAKSKGVMFDPVELDHDTVVSRLAEVVGQIERREVVKAFLGSLSTRDLGARSALGSWAVHRHARPHRFRTWSHMCGVCGLREQREQAFDLNVLAFERLKWGGVRHLSPAYALFDLELFLRETHTEPTALDLQIFKEIIQAIEESDESVTADVLTKTLPKSLKSNENERSFLIAILGFCGILGTSKYPGFQDRFTEESRREIPARRNVDMPYPACWWTRRDGIDRRALAEYFGEFLGS